jgi:hypothetical protein
MEESLAERIGEESYTEKRERRKGATPSKKQTSASAMRRQ